MNIQYQRNLKNSYMVVIEPGQRLNMDGQLAEKMIQRQKIPGLLYWVTMEHEGDMTFWYQISGLQSLSDWLTQHALDHKLLSHLLSGLLALQEELPRFYLRPEHVLLQLEQIFLDTSGEQIFFCYEPLWNKDPRMALQELMEQLLPKIDHGDKAAVGFGYGLYEKCQEENADIWHYVLEQNTGEIQIGQEVCEETVSGRRAQEEVCEEEPQYVQKEQRDRTAVKKGHGQRTRNRLLERVHRKLPDIASLPVIQSFGKKKQEQPASIYLFEPEEEEPVCENPTVFLGAKTTAEGRLLYRGGGEEKNFVIEGDSFIIGGRNEQADGQLLSDGISRSHARIIREEDQYYIEDLNSKNGTYLNGELLAYKQKRQVKPGDHLRFAREEYVFY
ncbi:MAG: DUF6382 domain-containing protein [bacterium]|nr:DUF6382 domain-containing protein [bacterium]MDY4100913.1 DUF6382 domain-containing protein [Lachnospiraceae bacterium]